MKNKTKFLVTVGALMAAISMVGCMGGGGGGGGSDKKKKKKKPHNSASVVYYTSYDSSYDSGYSGSDSGYSGYSGSGSSSGGTGGYSEGSDTVYDHGDGTTSGSTVTDRGGKTKDTNLQNAEREKLDINARAQNVAHKFQMSFEAAKQMTVLADQVLAMTANGREMTDRDRDAVTKSALGVAKLSTAEVNKAVEKAMRGDMSAADALMDKAAQNMGMPSTAALRDSLLPALGLDE